MKYLILFCLLALYSCTPSDCNLCEIPKRTILKNFPDSGFVSVIQNSYCDGETAAYVIGGGLEEQEIMYFDCTSITEAFNNQ